MGIYVKGKAPHAHSMDLRLRELNGVWAFAESGLERRSSFGDFSHSGRILEPLPLAYEGVFLAATGLVRTCSM